MSKHHYTVILAAVLCIIGCLGNLTATPAPAPLNGLWRPADDSSSVVSLLQKGEVLVAEFRNSGSVRTEFFRLRPEAITRISTRTAIESLSKATLIVQTLDANYGGLDYVQIDLVSNGETITRDLALNRNAGGFICHLQAEGSGTIKMHELSFSGRPITSSLHVSALAGLPDHNTAADAHKIAELPVKLLPPSPYKWDHVVVGGGGTVRTIKSHPADGTIAMGADIAGVFFRDRIKAQFDAKMDFLGPEDYGTFHTDIIAFDPQNSDNLLYVGGKEWRKGGGVLITKDRGKTWTRAQLRNPDGNPVFISNASTAPRLAIDPDDGQLAWYGSRRDGLYQTTDGGHTWKNIPVSGMPWNQLAVEWILALPSEDKTRPWLAAFKPYGKNSPVKQGIYKTDDNGITWHKLDIPFAAIGNLSPDGRWLLLSDRKLWRVDLTSDTTEEITPLDLSTTQGKMWGYSTLAASPENSDWLVVFTRSHGDGAFFRSKDGGKNWERFDNREHRQGKRLIYEHAPYEAHVGGGCHVFNGVWDVVFDTAYPKQLWVAFWPGILASDDIWATPLVFRAASEGHEEVCVFDLVTPSHGAPVVSGLMDVGGFVHWDTDKQPETTMIGVSGPEGPHGQIAPLEVTSLDFCEAQPEFLVAGACWRYFPPPDGNGSGNARYSEDGGKTWRQFPSKPFPGAKDGRIAVSATSPDNIVWAARHDRATGIWYTRDRGRTWHPSKGAPTGIIWPDLVFTFYKPLAADRKRDGVFYLYDKNDGRFYRSEDGGAVWRHVSRLPAQGGAHYVNHRIIALPGLGGHLFAALQEHGLFRSQDAGNTWVRLTGIDFAESAGTGMPSSRDTPPSLWLIGRIKGETDPALSIYRSNDLGASWTRIDDATLGWPSESIVAGDRQRPDRVYVGTNGRGIFRATSSKLPSKKH